MDPASRLLSTVLPALLARAPLTTDKVEFAWRTVVGSAMARATRVRLLESGQRGAYATTLQKLASALRVAPTELMLGPRPEREEHASK